MHPTADTRAVINLRRVARRVMPGVGRLMAEQEGEKVAGGLA
jgi:hypothetical protein